MSGKHKAGECVSGMRRAQARERQRAHFLQCYCCILLPLACSPDSIRCNTGVTFDAGCSTFGGGELVVRASAEAIMHSAGGKGIRKAQQAMKAVEKPYAEVEEESRAYNAKRVKEMEQPAPARGVSALEWEKQG